MSIRTERLGNIFVEEISKIIASEIKDENIKFVTITNVRVSSDLSYAKVYFTTINEEKKVLLENSLNKASSFIRSELCKRVTYLRKMPELNFVYDDSISYGMKIENIIEEIHEKDSK